MSSKGTRSDGYEEGTNDELSYDARLLYLSFLSNVIMLGTRSFLVTVLQIHRQSAGI
jgi:hypothetical protein